MEIFPIIPRFKLIGPLLPGFEEYEKLDDDSWGSELHPGRCSTEAPATQNLNDTTVVPNGNNERFLSAIEPISVSLVQSKVSLDRLSTNSSENCTSEDGKNMATDSEPDPDIDCDSDLDMIESLGRPEGYESAQSFENEEVYTSDEDSNPTIAIEPLDQISVETLSRGDENENDSEQTNIKKRKSVNRGLEHKSSNIGKTIPVRMMQRGCGPGCKFKCGGKISKERRGFIFKVYYSIPNQSTKYDYIARHVKEMKKQTNQGEVTRKSYTCLYSLTMKITKVSESAKLCFQQLSIYLLVQ
ncbi:hypothetical protein QAD02_014082 [Eretmocerus hayati]|uniref:Uncharacterized protein n=1 Tax=Eretmocerus hayati TaxID=131215 RepID=A0ACC2P3Y8_9HYME|nr:hypothetical protein QAD02_014082 [Eretmocerus hayati]